MYSGNVSLRIDNTFDPIDSLLEFIFHNRINNIRHMRFHLKSFHQDLLIVLVLGSLVILDDLIDSSEEFNNWSILHRVNDLNVVCEQFFEK